MKTITLSKEQVELLKDLLEIELVSLGFEDDNLEVFVTIQDLL